MSQGAAAARIGTQRVLRERSALMAALRSCFARAQTWLQARKYVSALAGGLASRNGWSIAEHAGDRSPDRSQRLLNRASWQGAAAMSQVRRLSDAASDDLVIMDAWEPERPSASKSAFARGFVCRHVQDSANPRASPGGTTPEPEDADLEATLAPGTRSKPRWGSPPTAQTSG